MAVKLPVPTARTAFPVTLSVKILPTIIVSSSVSLSSISPDNISTFPSSLASRLATLTPSIALRIILPLRVVSSSVATSGMIVEISLAVIDFSSLVNLTLPLLAVIFSTVISCLASTTTLPSLVRIFAEAVKLPVLSTLSLFPVILAVAISPTALGSFSR